MGVGESEGVGVAVGLGVGFGDGVGFGEGVGAGLGVGAGTGVGVDLPVSAEQPLAAMTRTVITRTRHKILRLVVTLCLRSGQATPSRLPTIIRPLVSLVSNSGHV